MSTVDAAPSLAPSRSCLKIGDVAKRLNVAISTARLMLKDGRLPAPLPLMKHPRWDAAEFEKWLVAEQRRAQKNAGRGK
jgi:hypothetical protein